MSDTPRTDEFIKNLKSNVVDCAIGGSNLADFARQLERELNCFCRELGEENVVSAMVALQRLKKERDDAIAFCARMKNIETHEAELKEDNITLDKRCRMAEKERDEARECLIECMKYADRNGAPTKSFEDLKARWRKAAVLE